MVVWHRLCFYAEGRYDQLRQLLASIVLENLVALSLSDSGAVEHNMAMSWKAPYSRCGLGCCRDPLCVGQTLGNIFQLEFSLQCSASSAITILYQLGQSKRLRGIHEYLYKMMPGDLHGY